MSKKINNRINYKRKRIVRVVVRYKNGNFSSGTGFFVSNEGLLLTCFHVVFGNMLKNIRDQKLLSSYDGENEHVKLQNYFDSIIQTIEIEFFDGSKKDAKLLKFSEIYDVASVKVEGNPKTYFLKMDTNSIPEYDKAVFFCGYQYSVGYQHDNFPFATNRGVISSFPETVIGGDKYKHIQLNSINLGGNSGAPVFCESKNDVVAIVNGNMNWGSDNLAFLQKNQGTDKILGGSFRVPLSIAYVTPLKIIKEMTEIFE